MLDAAAYPLRAKAAPPLPVDRMVIGQRIEDAADLLPRLFNLCRVAQGVAARAAFGLDPEPGWQAALRAEILREHVVKLCLKWPGLLSLPPVALPRDWASNPAALRRALFGQTCAVPADLDQWCASGEGSAPVLRALRDLFDPGEATRGALPLTGADTALDPTAQENSVAARHADHPLLRTTEQRYGRGPLWSAIAVLIDIDATLEGALPPAEPRPGRAVVPAARGLYAIEATVTDGIVRSFVRMTPTDHLLAPQGALAQALASLPASRAQALAPIVVAVMDPCVPLTLEPADA